MNEQKREEHEAPAVCRWRVSEDTARPLVYCHAPTTLKVYEDGCRFCAYFFRAECSGHDVCEAHGVVARTVTTDVWDGRPHRGGFRATRIHSLVGA